MPDCIIVPHCQSFEWLFCRITANCKKSAILCYGLWDRPRVSMATVQNIYRPVWNQLVGSVRAVCSVHLLLKNIFREASGVTDKDHKVTAAFRPAQPELDFQFGLLFELKSANIHFYLKCKCKFDFLPKLFSYNCLSDSTIGRWKDEGVVISDRL